MGYTKWLLWMIARVQIEVEYKENARSPVLALKSKQFKVIALSRYFIDGRYIANMIYRLDPDIDQSIYRSSSSDG